MSDWATALLRSVPRQVILPGAGALYGSLDMVEQSASAVYPAANRALYFPFLIDTPVTVTQAFAYNGTVEKGKLDIAILDASWNRLVNKGLTAQSGTSALQLLDLTDTLLMPGLYYGGFTATSTEATYFRGVTSAIRLQAAGVQQQALGAEVEIPTTATPANPASAYIPVFGFSLSDSAVF
jgi:hypothetical protein